MRYPMCYHVYMSRRRQVGMRAMRQNLSVYLRRAGSGETFEVTTRGRPVAVLAPFEAAATPLERLEASGRATAADGDLLDLGPPTTLRRRSLSRALQEQRGERL
jgi:prevent-host-death family protein